MADKLELTVGTLRTQTALSESRDRVVIKQGDRYFLGRAAWPDTSMSPRGKAFYVDIDEEEMLVVNTESK
jgi:hypothetical protein